MSVWDVTGSASLSEIGEISPDLVGSSTRSPMHLRAIRRDLFLP